MRRHKIPPKQFTIAKISRGSSKLFLYQFKSVKFGKQYDATGY